MTQDLYLSIDVGTGSVRAALVDAAGRILAIASSEHEQIVPRYGWSEQRPTEWWHGLVRAIGQVLRDNPGARDRIAAVCACGQMHATVLVDVNGELTRPTAPLWNDKRTAALVAEFETRHRPADYLAQTANPPTPAWPAFKLQWLRDHDPDAYRAARIVLAPKDYLNFRLTGQIATDPTEASLTFLMDPTTREWSAPMIDRLDIDGRKLPPIRPPAALLGAVTGAAARETGLREGTPVAVGAADYPAALLGSGACRPGLGSEVMGTSAIVTAIASEPLLDPEISNVATVEGHWGPFVLLDAGGDSMRWARRAFHDTPPSYEEIVARAAEVRPGADALFFLPYLSGERLGAHRNSRAQFFGLAAGHGSAHLHRAVMEGVAFAVARHLRTMEHALGQRIERIIGSGGGAKAGLWLKIKASVYGIPIVVPAEAECGLVGCAAIAAAATQQFSSAEQAAAAFVRYGEEIPPVPAWSDVYAKMQPVFDRLYS
ncbi:MAG TPA: FGGY family carbohydrate kinase, partial [Burkholderiaceae bacterium]|nr:FGGY family carbohydrate kinase [Burkholderiaceae bacterium]